jgi:hypothetical protein
MKWLKLCVIVLAISICVGDQCLRKENLCHEVLEDRVSCVLFTGERLLLSCAGLNKEKVVFLFLFRAGEQKLTGVYFS